VIIIRDIEQGTPEWKALRCAIPTASNYGMIYTKTGKASTQAKGYMYKLLAEHLAGPAEDSYTNEWIERGKVLEGEARDNYAFMRDCEPDEVAFCYKDEDKLTGCSPDALIGDDGLLEIKCPAPHTHVKYLLDGGLPTDYFAQVQGQLWVTGRKWCDFVSYHPDMKSLIVRVDADLEWQAGLEKALNKFIKGMLENRERLTE